MSWASNARSGKPKQLRGTLHSLHHLHTASSPSNSKISGPGPECQLPWASGAPVSSHHYPWWDSRWLGLSRFKSNICPNANSLDLWDHLLFDIKSCLSDSFLCMKGSHANLLVFCQDTKGIASFRLDFWPWEDSMIIDDPWASVEL